MKPRHVGTVPDDLLPSGHLQAQTTGVDVGDVCKQNYTALG